LGFVSVFIIPYFGKKEQRKAGSESENIEDGA